MKHALSSYLVKYIFRTTCKARSKLRILGLLGARARTCYVGRAHLTYDLPRVPSHPQLRSLSCVASHTAVDTQPSHSPQRASPQPGGTRACDAGWGRGWKRLGAISAGPPRAG